MKYKTLVLSILASFIATIMGQKRELTPADADTIVTDALAYRPSDAHVYKVTVNTDAHLHNPNSPVSHAIEQLTRNFGNPTTIRAHTTTHYPWQRSPQQRITIFHTIPLDSQRHQELVEKIRSLQAKWTPKIGFHDQAPSSPRALTVFMDGQLTPEELQYLEANVLRPLNTTISRGQQPIQNVRVDETRSALWRTQQQTIPSGTHEYRLIAGGQANWSDTLKKKARAILVPLPPAYRIDAVEA